MGTFEGHVLPGSAFLLLGVWWTVNIYRHYHQAKARKTKYTAKITYELSFCTTRANCNRLPWEGVVKVVGATAGIILEVIEGGDQFHADTKQHIVMYLYFLMSGIIDILVYFRCPLPPAIDHVAVSVIFAMEMLTFSYHLHGRSDLDKTCHTFLIYTIAATVAVTTAEIAIKHCVLLSLARAFFVCLQGTWFWQIAFILYSPIPGVVPWDETNHDSSASALIYFSGHVMCVLVVVLGIGVLVKFVVNPQKQTEDGPDDEERLWLLED